MDRRTRPLHVLMVEDSPNDAELIVRAMRGLAAPVEHRRVTGEQAMRDALAAQVPDIILSDFALPGFSGEEALRIAKERVPDTPFLFVSGTIGEELAIEALQQGADDYVLKDNLRRLPSAMDRALRAAGERADRMRMAHALQESEERFRSIVESSLDWIWEVDTTGRIVYSNEAVRDILGFGAREVVGRNMIDLLAPASRAAVEALIPQHMIGSNRWRRRRLHFLDRDGATRILLSNARSLHDAAGHVLGFRGTHHDDTERLAQDAKIRQLVRIHTVLSAFSTHVLRATNRREVLERACAIAVEQGGFRAAAIATRIARPATGRNCSISSRATATPTCCAASRAAKRCRSTRAAPSTISPARWLCVRSAWSRSRISARAISRRPSSLCCSKPGRIRKSCCRSARSRGGS